ncbi:unnamed protein product [Notodromas monacha]|uniref:Uncharacterized protein n=1 Tax=Notodromas monacha TaxID=399045 RepID=A0A7R9BS48_9CRUS|nr:unnamed protein product [Notodromas monacha]CAG0920347.1 unnamed protein product [Notodromas monacha]
MQLNAKSAIDHRHVINIVTDATYAHSSLEKSIPESVKLVEEILMEQLKIILRKATECAICRGSPGNLVAEDFVFLMRRNHGKLRRLLQYLAAREKVQATVPEQDAEVRGVLSDVLQFLENMEISLYTVEKSYEDFVDEIKLERELRLEKLSRSLSSADYVKFTRARQVHFARTKELRKVFDTWLNENLKVKVTLSAGATLILQYLAHETIALLMDYGFIVRRDQRACLALAFRPDGLLEPGIPGFEVPPCAGFKDPLTPVEIREAFRRATVLEGQVGSHNIHARISCGEVIIAV